MERFSTPAANPITGSEFLFASAEGEVEISDADWLALRAAAGGELPAVYTRSIEPATLGAQTVALSCMFMAFEGDKATDVRSSLRFEVRLEATDELPESKNFGGPWDAIASVATPLIGRIPAELEMRLAFPSTAVTFPVKLPILLPDVAGFRDIRGVRLTQSGPDGDERELYDVVIDYHGDRSTIHVSTIGEIDFGADVLVNAFARTESIARLAVLDIEVI